MQLSLTPRLLTLMLNENNLEKDELLEEEINKIIAKVINRKSSGISAAKFFYPSRFTFLTVSSTKERFKIFKMSQFIGNYESQF